MERVVRMVSDSMRKLIAMWRAFQYMRKADVLLYYVAKRQMALRLPLCKDPLVLQDGDVLMILLLPAWEV